MAKAKSASKRNTQYIHIMLIVIVVLEIYTAWQVKNILNIIPLLSQGYPIGD